MALQSEESAPMDLDSLSKEDLVGRIRQLEFHVNQLRNIIAKADGSVSTQKKKYKSRPFDWNKQNKRHVLLKVSYLGYDYNGYVVQEDTTHTIEHILFNAFISCKLIECREKSNYHRCGRTDKGVSAFCQVISIDLRSTQKEGLGVVPAPVTDSEQTATKPELDYINILNRVLPPEIRVTAWAPVPQDFSARFDCQNRIYRYFFPRGDLDTSLMNEGAQKLIGVHDFRNLCKMDVGNGVVDFTRSIEEAYIEEPDNSDGYTMCTFVIKSKAFLWHQIRCIMAILLTIGKRLEPPTIIDELFDVTKNPCKPQYTMASELPLNLFDCSYDNIDWVYDKETVTKVLTHYQKQWAEFCIKASMTKAMIERLSQDSGVSTGEVYHQADFLLPDYRRTCEYRPLMSRTKCSSLEDRKAYFAKRRKLDKVLASETQEPQHCVTEALESSEQQLE